ncbi:hypothetical protein BS78_03G143300 [Paspalum vaginatum]|nr:hypothetical protein BS78_03G143300 [Paspalum vaginatum]
MAHKAMLHVHLMLVPLLSLLPFSSLALTQDFCVADLHRPDTPAGYTCKDAKHVDADDFHSSALAKPGSIVVPSIFHAAFDLATAKQWPAVNGVGLGFVRYDIDPGGVVPAHTHPRASEVVYVIEGSMVAGFVSSDANKVYMKRVDKGGLFLIPLGLQHFLYNTGNTTVVAIGTYSSSNPGVQATNYALFGNDLAVTDVEKVTFIKEKEIERLKKIFFPSSVPDGR